MAVLNLLREKVAILGYAEDTLWDAPFKDEMWCREKGCEIWGLNDLYRKDDDWQKRLRYDRWFEIHTRGKSTPEHLDWLRGCGVSVYMQKHHDDIPQSIAFPLEEAMRHFGTRYFTNSFSYELALAIMEGFKEIHLYGVNMASWEGDGPPEISDQRASIEFFIGWAMAKGIRVLIPEASDLLKTAVLYGYDEHADSVRQKAMRRQRNYLKRAAEYQGFADLYRGRAEGIEELARSWMPMDGDE